MVAVRHSRDDGVQPGIDLLTRHVRHRTDMVADAAAAAIWDEVEAYSRHADALLRAEVAAHCNQVFHAFFTTMEDRRHPTRGDFPWTGNHAMRRVDLGISLPDFMKAFRIGQITLWDDILVGVSEHPDTQDAALLMVNQVMRTIEVGSSAAAESYLEAQQYKVADNARLARDLLEDLLGGRPPAVGPRVAALREAGITEEERLVVVVASLPAGSEGPGARTMPSLKSALGATAPGLVVIRHDEVVAVQAVPGSTDRFLGEVRRIGQALVAQGLLAGIGVSSCQTGWDRLPGMYDEACAALQALGGKPGVQAVTELSTLEVLVRAQDPSATRLLRPQVRSFIEADLAEGGSLLQTLRVYVACDLNARQAAMQLHVHANTIYYRLERISERTGCDTHRVEDLIDLLLAVRLMSRDA